ncbi:MAG: DUF192 domain-containing protein [Actinomycetota bacterium]|nr:DUF192 domain-containing protein [Actinomycetota bacterium]
MNRQVQRVLVTTASLIVVVGSFAAACEHPPEPLGHFPRTTIGLIGPAGGHEQLKVAVADTQSRRLQGLQGPDKLGPLDGMLFHFPSVTITSFHMRHVSIPLWIAWFDVHGRLVAATLMAPCPSGNGCPHYRSPLPYRDALELGVTAERPGELLVGAQLERAA